MIEDYSGSAKANKRNKKRALTSSQVFAIIVLVTVVSQGMLMVLYDTNSGREDYSNGGGSMQLNRHHSSENRVLKKKLLEKPSLHPCHCVDCDEDTFCGHLWRGGSSVNIKGNFSFESSDGKPRLSVVVSHCKEDLSWASEYLKDVSAVHSITIISKCNQSVAGMENLPTVLDSRSEHVRKDPTIIIDNNVGRCDHSYAKFMLSHVKNTIKPIATPMDWAGKDDVVLFLKDNVNRRQGKGRSLRELVETAINEGFACYYFPEKHKSFYHSTDVTLRYNMTRYVGRVTKGQQHKHKSSHDFKSPLYKNMKHWVNDMSLKLPHPVFPVCYGGLFAVRKDRIEMYSTNMYMKIVKSLSRGDNIEEGHFAERSWAAIFRVPLQQQQMDFLQTYSNHTFVEVAKSGGGTLGALMTHNPYV